MELASGKESCDCRWQIGQWASISQRALSRRRIHFNTDVDCGSQEEDVEDVDVVVFPFTPVSKVQDMKGKECIVGREISSGGKVTKEVSACPPVVSLPE